MKTSIDRSSIACNVNSLEFFLIIKFTILIIFTSLNKNKDEPALRTKGFAASKGDRHDDNSGPAAIDIRAFNCSQGKLRSSSV